MGDLWQTVTSSWLRLTIPDTTDSNRSRWPVHPLWARINDVLWLTLTRQYTPARVPSDDYLVRQYMSLVASFMAKYDIQDFEQGAAKFHEEAKRIVVGLCQDKLEIRFEDWIAQQRAIKARQFNSRRNTPSPKQDARTSDEVDRDTIQYDQSSNGE